jgi:hypothetical protein
MRDIFEDSDPFDHPAWQRSDTLVGAPPRPPKGYVTCNVAWLARALPRVRSVKQLVTLLLIYRRCLWERSRTVSLPNADLASIGMDRRRKNEAIDALAELGLITREPWDGRTVRVTLTDFP